MKLKLFLSLLTLFVLSFSPAYASFPVEKTVVINNSVSKEVKQKETMSSPAAASGGKSQLAALLICFFVGIIGIHRFYLGYTWQGIVQILTLGGLGIWTLIDFIRIITGDLKPKDGEYAKTL
ncbi:TM2 domain-containing protein [Flavobacterium solisilvae]|uniref:TM2 domain-containing protein n=1 Tax=Flavobacterium solisilvae TaxID=1852019 RepID=A0ABX1QVC5_9FLAO|nr:TM2 domain-containing protein [Flavobacterium solisilvae]NMH25043.1 TM2 domain-containing protein [Flavobacterium solisilvae]